MNKAKVISRYSVHVINYDTELSKIDTIYKSDIAKYGVADEVINPILKKKEEKRTFEELLLLLKEKRLKTRKRNSSQLLKLSKSSFHLLSTESLGSMIHQSLIT